MQARYKAAESDLIKQRGNSVKNLDITFTLNFKEAGRGNMLLSWVDIDLAYDQLYRPVNRPKRRIKTTIQCFVYQQDPPLKKAPKQVEGDQPWYDYEAIRSRLYIKSFWDENPVIAQTALQQRITADFESKGSFGMAYSETSDTMSLFREGYALLTNKVNRLTAAISNEPSLYSSPSCIALMINGTTRASLCSHLFVAHNCFKDSFRFYVLPLLDTTQTWISDSIKMDDSFPELFRLYSRLSNIHAARLSSTLRNMAQPCNKDDEIAEMIIKANEALYQEQSELILDLWHKGEFRFWERYIDKAEKE